MSISTSTAVIIATRDDLIYTHTGPANNGKYSGYITMPSGRLLINTTAIFDTPELAETHMNELRKQCVDYFDSLQINS